MDNDPDKLALARRVACKGCGSKQTDAELVAGGFVACCPDRSVDRVIAATMFGYVTPDKVGDAAAALSEAQRVAVFRLDREWRFLGLASRPDKTFPVIERRNTLKYQKQHHCLSCFGSGKVKAYRGSASKLPCIHCRGTGLALWTIEVEK